MKILYHNFIELDQDQSAFIEPEEFFELDEIMENPIVKRVISVFDKNKDGKISFFELVIGLSALTDYSYNKLEKLKFAFQVYDSNGDDLLVMAIYLLLGSYLQGIILMIFRFNKPLIELCFQLIKIWMDRYLLMNLLILFKICAFMNSYL